MVLSLIIPLRNDGPDSMLPEPLTDAGIAVSLGMS